MKLLQFCLLLILPGFIFAQKTSVFSEKTAEFERGLDLYDQGIYGAAFSAFEHSSKIENQNNDPKVTLLTAKSILMMGKSSVRIGKPDAEMVMLSYFRQNQPDALAYEAVMDLGNYYYSKKNYDEALSFYAMIVPTTLSDEQRSEILFKKGYAQFFKKKYPEAKASFASIKNIKNKYQEQAIYYYGLSAYYTDDFDNAVTAFKSLTQTRRYKSVVPVHICQILLAQKKYDELIAFAEPLLGDSDIKKQPEIRQMLGQAYFGRGDYEKALPYLEEFAENSSKMTHEDYFRLGVAQYKIKEYNKAITTLKPLEDDDSELGMYAMFYSGDSYLKLNDKNAARNAFLKASSRNYDPEIAEEALFNYAKLSAELNYNKEALTALQQIKSGSKHYNESQELISEILINSGDYEKAIKLLESFPNKSVKMTETYQKVLFYRGIQLHSQKSWDACQPLFKKAMVTGSDVKIKAMSHFFLGDAYYNKNDVKNTRSELNTFIQMAEGINNLPPQSSVAAANYDLGYTYLNEENYNEALKYFEKAMNGFKRVNKSEDAYVVESLIPDIIMRTGDCYLKKNNYTKAKEYYNLAINNNYPNAVYAMYQKAMILGLQGDKRGKIMALTNIANQYGKSEYADDALLELGNTYDGMNRLQDGIATLNRLVEEHGKTSNLVNKALLKMGLMYYNSNEYNNALRSYKQVFNYNPTKEEGNTALAAIKEIYITDLKKPDEYFAYAETIPGYKANTDEKEDAAYQVAEGYYQEGKYAEAVTSFTDYIKKYPKGTNTMDAIFYRGECFTALKKYGEGLADYKAIISAGKSEFYEDALEKAAIISYNYSQNFNDAYDYYSTLAEVTTKEDKRFEAQLGALRSANRIGKHNEVIRLADIVIQSDKSTKEQKTSAQFYRAKSAQELKDYNTALESYNEVIRNSSNEQTAESRYRVAQIYYMRNDAATAEQLAQEAMEANNDYPYWVAKALILTADILSDKGNYLDAKAALEAVLENFHDDKNLSDEASAKLEAVKKKEAGGKK
ncbi:MAG: tetratricopeptide repeat protein [Saprospiraceae bacterium]|nr:tetratricopeptide repeat protein [Saprospiraceae bacterium]